jgi:hypothetical protein
VVLPGSSDPDWTKLAAPPGVPVLGAVAVRQLDRIDILLIPAVGNLVAH